MSDLSGPDIGQFREIACECARQINCLTKAEAREIVFHLREERIVSAIGLLRAMGSDGLLKRVLEIYPSQEPDDDTLRTLCEQANLKMCRPQTLELERRMLCKAEKVANFLVSHEGLFRRDPRLLWNTDETQLNTLKRFKMLCDQGQLPLVTAFEHIPHLTEVVSISGSGAVLPPIIILKNLQHLRELTTYESHCLFATSANGWIMMDL
jgi:hypothetical protein